MSHYNISFVLNGSLKTFQIPFEIARNPAPVSLSKVKERLKFKNKQYTNSELNAIGHVLIKYPDATQFDVESVVDNEQQDDKKGLILILAFIIALIIAPVLITLGMYNKFILKGLYSKSQSHPKYKKFRKIYIAIAFSFFAACIALFIVFIIINKGDMPVSLPIYLLVGGNVIGFIITIIYSKKLAKEAPKVEVSSTPITTKTVKKTIDIEKNNEIANLLIKYKDLLDQKIITNEEYEKLRESALAMMVEEEVEEETVEEEIDDIKAQETAQIEYLESFNNESHSIPESNDSPSAIESVSEENLVEEPKVNRKKLFQLDYPYEGSEDNETINFWLKQYRINSFVTLFVFLASVVTFIAINFIQFQNLFYVQFGFMVLSLIFSIVLFLSRRQLVSNISKFVIYAAIFAVFGTLNSAMLALVCYFLIIPIIYTIIVSAKTGSKIKNERFLFEKERLENNPYENYENYYKWDISKLKNKDKWVAGRKIDSCWKLDKVSVIFMTIFLLFSAFSFVFIFVPFRITLPGGQILICSPIYNDVSWRLALIFVFFFLSVIMFALRVIFFKKNSTLFELFFAICTPVFLLFNSLSLYSAFGNQIIGLIDDIAAGVVAVFYLVLLLVKLSKKKDIDRFIYRCTAKEKKN